MEGQALHRALDAIAAGDEQRLVDTDRQAALPDGLEVPLREGVSLIASGGGSPQVQPEARVLCHGGFDPLDHAVTSFFV